MMNLCCDVIKALRGRTFATAESCTGGGIGAAITAVPGSSVVFKGGIISYTNEVKHSLLQVDSTVLEQQGAVSAAVAEAMAHGVRTILMTDIAVSVTGLAGPSGDEYGNPVGTVFIGFSDKTKTFSREYHFEGNREEIRNQTIHSALLMILEHAL